MDDPQPLSIFVAAPSDCDDERAIIQRTVTEWNQSNLGGGFRFDAVGWDRVRGTARRAQAAINELIAESHFLVAIFNKRWGSDPGGTWGYTSGTEEELFRGLLELSQMDQPMRDVWVAFLDTPDAEPGVTNLKKQLIEQHAMLFESIAGATDLKRKFSARIDRWAEAAATPKRPRHVELVSSTGSEILRAERLRVEGEKLIDLGHAAPGLENLREASQIGGPLENLAYARHLARQGDLEQSSAVTNVAIEKARHREDGLFSTIAAGAFAAQAGILRRRGEHLAAIGRLEQALTLIHSADTGATLVRCRLLDEIGLARKAAGDLEGARVALEESFGIRKVLAAPTEICQSLINLARLCVEDGDIDMARHHSDESLELLRETPPAALHANAQTLAAQIRLRQGSPSEGIGFAEQAVALNKQFGSANSEAIALHVLTQCYRASARPDLALVSGQACLEINERIGNTRGADNARWQLARIAEQCPPAR